MNQTPWKSRQKHPITYSWFESYIKYFLTTFLTFALVTGMLLLFLAAAFKCDAYGNGPHLLSKIKGISYEEACTLIGFEYNSPKAILFTVLGIFEMIFGPITMVIFCAAGYDVSYSSTRIDINGKNFDLVKYGLGGYALYEGIGVGDGGNLLAIILYSLFIGYPMMVLGSVINPLIILISSKYRKALSEVDVGYYWYDYFRIDEFPKTLLSFIFIFIHIVLSIVILAL